MLTERGLVDFSIPELAVRLRYSRAAIYNFFPTPNAIFHALSQRYLLELETSLLRGAPSPETLTWQDGAHAFTKLAGHFYNQNPAACALILGGPASNEGYVGQALLMQRLSALLQQRFARRGIVLPNAPADVALLSVEIGTACLRTSFFLHGKVTADYEREAAEAMIAYLSRYVATKPAANKTHSRPRAPKGS
jgi:AcrR family transcriptional regulator